MEFFSDLIQYGYLSNALAACVLSGITCGVVGTYVCLLYTSDAADD